MAPKRKKATTSSSLLAFGKRFRAYRQARGWTQEAVAKRANNGAGVKAQYIGAIENGRTRCSRKFIELMDGEFGAEGELVDLWDDLVKDAAFPTWFDWHVIESEAAELSAYSLSVVHGLLQTPEYAEVLLHGDKDKIEARMKRQKILSRQEPAPPSCIFLIDEAVLYRQVGSPETMARQCDMLIEVMSRRTAVQVVPMRADHSAVVSAFTFALLSEGKEIAYVECAARGFTMEDPEDIAAQRQALREVQSLALPRDLTIEMIQKIKVERWT
ncbi:helix-turn-helix transcriptional regulator [Spirillospora sp. NPDC049652]